MKRTSHLVKTILGLFLIFIVLLGSAGILVYRSTATTMKTQMGNKCMGIAMAAATLIERDVGDYRRFVETLDTTDAYYQTLKANMEKIRFGNKDNIAFLYAEIRISDTEMMYIVDGEIPGTDTYAPPGLTEPLTDTRRIAYETQAPHIGDFVTTVWGTLLSAYAPIFDADTGEFIGIIGADVSIEQYNEIMHKQLFVIVSGIAVPILMMLVLGGWLLHVYEQKLRSDEDSASKSNFLARMSHEIRTPMNAITGMTELILRENLAPGVREQALNIRQASLNLLTIINDILDFSKVESGKLEIVEERYSFSSLIDDIIGVIRVRMLDKPVALAAYIDRNIPGEMIGDAGRIRQILMNVLSNAIKYTEKGHVAIDITGKPGKNEDDIVLTMKVSDSGIGIKQEELGKLFNDFARLDRKRNLNIEGTGLGMAITKSLCILMGGNIAVSSVYGAGSVFTITLPQRCERRVPFAEVENPDAKRVLVYEHRDIYAEYMRKALTNLDVRHASVSAHSAFLTELQEKTYTHIFVSSLLYADAKRAAARLAPADPVLILLTEYGAHVPPGVLSIATPTHTSPIANALNGNVGGLRHDESDAKAISFVAPDARTLIVDDVRVNLNVAKGLLAPFQMIVDCASSGSEAIELVKANRYDLVLMDHMMPEMDGIETTAEIRALGERDDYFGNLPIVALSANAIFGVRDMFLQNGMDDYLAKPIDMEKLCNVLEKWIPKEKQKKRIEKTTVAEKPNIRPEGIDEKVDPAATGGNADGYKRTIATFYSNCLHARAQIMDALEKKDTHLFATHIRALKNVSASIGASALSEEAHLLEMAGNRKNMEYITDNIESFLRQLSNTADAVAKAFPHVKEPGKGSERF